MTTIKRASAAMLGLAAFIFAGEAPATQAGDAARIAATMHVTFDRPDVPLDAGPIVVSGDFSVADWTQSGAGGRALFKRGEQGWSVTYCSGDALKTQSGLVALGVPAAHAAQLETALVEAERSVSPERLAAMSAFDGTIAMGGDGGARP